MGVFFHVASMLHLRDANMKADEQLVGIHLTRRSRA